jgi:hypothetical protein
MEKSNNKMNIKRQISALNSFPNIQKLFSKKDDVHGSTECDDITLEA